jgi:hypothetical protein
MRGSMGEKIVLTLKFINQMNHRKKRRRSAFPLSELYRSTALLYARTGKIAMKS